MQLLFALLKIPLNTVFSGPLESRMEAAPTAPVRHLCRHQFQCCASVPSLCFAFHKADPLIMLKASVSIYHRCLSDAIGYQKNSSCCIFQGPLNVMFK